MLSPQSLKNVVLNLVLIKVAHEIVTDNTDDIVAAIDKVKAAGADIIFCTGGMSVDPDDLTPGPLNVMQIA